VASEPKLRINPGLDRGNEHEVGESSLSAPLEQALIESVRGALELARLGGTPVRVSLRADPKRSLPVRVIQGIVVEVTAGPDGRERVIIGVAEDTTQIVLLDRIVRVMTAE
jgi:hypothetical protein